MPENNTEKWKKNKRETGRTLQEGAETLIEKGKGWGEVSSLVGRSSDMRLLCLLIEMSPTSSSCEPNYNSNSS